MSDGHFKLVIEVEDDRHLRRLWTAIDWEDELFNGNITVHVQEVEYVPSAGEAIA